ncbi:MAG TPA: ATP-binding protein [bacterium]|nr:PAS domain-containing protein [Candidatus Omnitrophota bacterium]HOJ59820.1 ATP-binding protein [bacterium]
MEIYSQAIHEDKDILAVRDRARVVCEELGFGITQQLQVTTSVFELGKNILEHGKGGTVSFSLLTEGDTLVLEVLGKDNGPGMTEAEIEELLEGRSAKATANRGIPAMKRLMDSIEIESEPQAGTVIRMTKKKNKSSKTLAGNIVSFFQEKFSSRENPTLTEELRTQNTNLVQSLSLYEEKNEELERKNKELLDLKHQLEISNAELHERTAELQEALLSLGDRTSELESQNRRFTAVLEQMPYGVVITDRSGVITKANAKFYSMLPQPKQKLEELRKIDWYAYLSQFKLESDTDWHKRISALDDQPTAIQILPLRIKGDPPRDIQCRTIPIQDGDDKFIGRLWIFEEAPPAPAAP